MEKHEAMMLFCLAGLVVKDTGETVESFLSDAAKWADSIITPKEPITSQNQAEITEELKADIDEIYKAYPSKCPRRMQSTGKCGKDKDRIRILLTKKGKTKEEILRAIRQTINEGAYLKNFSTFLNNLPEIDDEVEIDQTPSWV